MGRPKLPKGEARNVLLAVRLSGDENQAIQGAIKSSKEEKTAWLRNALLRAAGCGKVGT